MRVEVAAQDVEQFQDDWIPKRVVNLIADLAVGDDPLGPEDGQMLGGVGLFQAELLNERSGGKFASAQGIHNGNAGGVRQRLENIGFETSERVYDWHLAIFEDTNIAQRPVITRKLV